MPVPPDAATTGPDDVGTAAHRPEADRDHPAGGAELRGRRLRTSAGRSGGSGSGSPRARGWCCTRRLRGRRPRPADPPPRLDLGDGRALRRPGADAIAQERLRRRRVQLRRAGQLARPRLRLPGRRSTTSTPRWSTATASPTTHQERRSACTRRTTASSGSTSTCAPRPAEVRRSRRLVVSFIATVGNYDYGFFWYLYQDGTIEFEVKLTGILSTGAVAAGRDAALRPAPQRGRPLRPDPPALLQLPARPRRRRPGERRLRSDTPKPTPPARRTRSATPSAPCAPSLAQRTGGAAASSTRCAARSGGSSTPTSATPSASRSATARARGATSWRCRPARLQRAAQRAGFMTSTSGSRRYDADASASPPATTPTSTRAAPDCRTGPRPTARSKTPTWCSGTPLGIHHVAAAGGLAGDARLPRRLHAAAGRLLRPQPGARRAAARPRA